MHELGIDSATVRKSVQVSGIVQGVGFRPWVYRLATERGLAGSVSNDARGVTIEIQGAAPRVDDFVAALQRDAPPLARIVRIVVGDLPPSGDRDFRIVETSRGEAVATLISPDVAVCDDCLREMFDPADRRYRYPFINCTNCGPRFTIIRTIPYDRPYTSMAAFAMCPACRAEYDDPSDRRFHAQPNACPECGPRLEYRGPGGAGADGDPLLLTVDALRRGLVVAIKGLGGFHLACDATTAEAVELLRSRKRRVEKPFAVMVPDLAAAAVLCALQADDNAALAHVRRPIVLLPRRDEAPVAAAVAPGNRNLGLFLPYAPLHHLLFAGTGLRALVMTSANRSEEPIAIGNEEAMARLDGLADAYLLHDRDILRRCDDSVVRRTGGKVRQIRRSRGWVPAPVFLAREVAPVLGVGGELKSTICLARGDQAFLSQHIGDLENAEAIAFFDEAVEHLERILEIEPVAVAHDLHPDYASTRWALRRRLPLLPVQHHHAHVVSCMAENGIEGRVIGFALDGTGYGTDGTIWGGEVLLADERDFTRAAHLECVAMPGGEAAVREPWRMALAYLQAHYGEKLFDLGIPFTRGLPRREAETLVRMIERGVNAPLTSSCGRLFDAVAALAGVRARINYEAQAAIELENLISGDDATAYPFESRDEDGRVVIGTRPLFDALVSDLRSGVAAGTISRRFHQGLVRALLDVALRLRETTALDRVCLSGGSFQNAFLFERLDAALRAEGFEVFSHSEVPCGDGGLSLGQAIVGASRLRG
ncbi:MAG TPA: carbamoyltransferase HypF [Thermoanaerobaculia bacterium]